MKKGIHPQYKVVTFTDISSGTKFKIGSTIDDISVEISSASHPFYTGEARIIDIENRVDSFEKKKTKADKMGNKTKDKKAKRLKRRKGKVEKVESKKTLTLKDMLKNVK